MPHKLKNKNTELMRGLIGRVYGKKVSIFVLSELRSKRLAGAKRLSPKITKRGASNATVFKENISNSQPYKIKKSNPGTTNFKATFISMARALNILAKKAIIL